MKAFSYDMFERLETPKIILSTKYHKHYDVITNIDLNSIDANFNLNSPQEISFDVYKELDGKKCNLWDKIIDHKYIFVPDYQEYYCISAPFDEDNKTIKHIVGTSACEYELSHRKLYNFECNTEADIARGDYIPTTLCNKDNIEASLLHRVLKDKCPDYKIGYVSPSIAKKQRVFSANDKDIYSFLTNDIATELECVFLFDSVNRVISVYAIDEYGENTGVYISPENYAESITVEGDVDNVFNCLKIEGGDELMTATVANLNPNGSNYIYRFSEDMLNDMPEELVEKIASYNELSTTLQPNYEEYTGKVYELIDEELYLATTMMPEVTTPETTATAEATNLVKQLKSVEVQNINVLSNASADLAVKGMTQVIVDPRYNIDVDSSTLSSVSNNKRIWSGIILITNKGDEEDTAKTSQFSVTIKSDNYETYLYQKIQKVLDRDDSVFYTIFEIEDMNTFRAELKKYSLDRLKSFESSYQTCLDVLIEQGITTDTKELYGVDLYTKMYKPYYDRIKVIQQEMVIRELEILEVQKEHAKYEELRREIQKQLNFKEYIGDDLWVIFSHYRLESTYKNDNYISEGLSNTEVIKLASELFERGKEETIKASELQYSLSASLNNLLNTKEFKPFKDKINIGNWINLETDEKLYKLRLINLGINYGSLDKITVLFADVFRVKQLGVVEDTKAVLEQAKSMANSYDYVAHQASQGNNANVNVKNWLEEGLNSSLVAIKNNNNEEVTYDKHGLLCKSYDDITDSYSPEQVKLTHNILCYTSDAWETVSLAIGKHNYVYYNESTDEFATATDFGVSAKFLTAGYINGSQIVGGDIYSQNFSPTTGTHFNLNSGELFVAGGKLKYDPVTNIFNLSHVTLDWNTTTSPSISNISGLDEKLNDITDSITNVDETFAKELTNYVTNTVFNGSISELQSQIDGNITTWFEDGLPTLNNYPANEWTTDEIKSRHLGDLYYDGITGYAYRFQLTGSKYEWVKIVDTDITRALADAKIAQDTADGKRRVFVTTPTPPYDVGDLWVQGNNGDIMRCATSKEGGSYSASDWIKASKYTDDTALTDFISGDYASTLQNINSQIDGKARSWYQSTDPSKTWDKTEDHEGDLWYNTSASSQVTSIYQNGAWRATSVPKSLFDTIDGIASIYVTIPDNPVVGDLLIPNSNSSGLKADKVYRYDGSIWTEIAYTDDTAANNVEAKIIEILNGSYKTQIGEDYVITPHIAGGDININNRFKVDSEGNVTLPDNATITWSQVTGTDNIAYTNDIPTNTNQLVNGAGFTTMSAVEAKGYETASSIKSTVITKDYIETLSIKAGSVDAEDITGTTISGKTIITDSGTIAGWTLSPKAFYNGTNSLTSTTAGTYIGTDGIRQYASADSYTNIVGGKITTNNADIKGKISADTFDIGGNTISIESKEDIGLEDAISCYLYDNVTKTVSVAIGHIDDICEGNCYLFNTDLFVYSKLLYSDELVVKNNIYANNLSTLGDACLGKAYIDDLTVGFGIGTPIRLIKSGSSVFTNLTVGSGGNTSIDLFSMATIQGWCSSANFANTTVLVSNADASVNSVHVDGAALLGSKWYATFDRATSAAAIRVNWTVIVWA